MHCHGVVALPLFLGGLCIACGPSGSALPPPLPPISSSTDAPSAAEAPDGDDDATAVLFGRFRHVGGDADLEARDAAIDAALAELPYMARERGGRRLRERTTIVPQIAIVDQGENVSVELGGKVVLTAPRGGQPVDFTPPNGDATVKLSHQMRGDQLVQTMQGDRGGTRRIYTPQPDDKLVVQVTVYAARLPKNIVFDLHYALDASSDASAPTAAPAPEQTLPHETTTPPTPLDP
jgi:hypothetical protein